jgi:hypothetical protein
VGSGSEDSMSVHVGFETEEGDVRVAVRSPRGRTSLSSVYAGVTGSEGWVVENAVPAGVEGYPILEPRHDLMQMCKDLVVVRCPSKVRQGLSTQVMALST